MRVVKSLLVLALGLSVAMVESDAFAAKKKKGGKKGKKKTEETAEGGEGEAAAEGEAAPADAAAAGGGWAMYGMAGCGLGSIIIKGQGKMMQVFAATSNASSYSQTFGITSGTSNCKEAATPAEARQMQQEMFIAANLKWLEKDAARGDGEMLKAFAEVLGCNQENFAVFASATQQNYEMIFNSELPNQVLNNYLDVVRSNETLLQVCPEAV